MLRLDGYEYMLRWRGDTTRLVVGLSHDRRLVLDRLDTKCNYAHIYEPGPNRYYTRSADIAVEQIAKWVRDHEIRDVCFFGYSKGGYGALLWSTMLAAALPAVRVTCLALSPQVSLWPLNVNIVQPSYRDLVTGIAQRDGGNPADADLRRFGNISDPSDLKNYRARIVYPAGSKPDRLEAESIFWSNADRVPLPITNHNVLIPYMWDVSDHEAVAAAVGSLLRARARDKDVASFLGDARFESMVAEYRALAPHPLLPEALRDLMSGPNPHS